MIENQMKKNESNALSLLEIHMGRKLRQKRQKLCMSLLEAATQLKISPQQLQKYEQAENRISAGFLYKASRLYGLKLSYFYEGFSLPSADKKENCAIIALGKKKALNVLLVEPDPSEELLTRKALLEADKRVKLFCLHSGKQVLDYLRYKKIEADFPRADIILLELNLPKSEDGHFVLRELKRDPHFQDIPIIIITHNTKLQEVYQAYKSFASGYVCKAHHESFKKAIKGVVRYWSSCVILPHAS